jgi:hypothetical protein
MDLATATAEAYVEVAIDGLRYKLGTLTLARWGALQAWLKAHARDPVAEALAQLARAARDGVPIRPESEQFLLREARSEARHWPPRIASTEFFDLLARTEGGDVQFAWEVLRVHQPSITLEQAADLNAKMAPEDTARVIYAALGIAPPNPGDRGPKADGPPSPPGGTTGRPSSPPSPSGTAGGPTSSGA